MHQTGFGSCVLLVQDVLVQGLETHQQPNALGPQGARLSGRAQPDLDALSALLGEDISLTPEQLQLLHNRLQQQLAEQRAAMEQEEAEEGVFFDPEAEGVQHSLEEEGVAFEFDAAQGAASSSTSKQHFECLLSSPLWRCQGEMAQVQLYQAIFLLMAWKMDYVVRDAAFVALLGMLCKLLLPKVSCRLLGASTWAYLESLSQIMLAGQPGCRTACPSAPTSDCMLAELGWLGTLTASARPPDARPLAANLPLFFGPCCAGVVHCSGTQLAFLPLHVQATAGCPGHCRHRAAFM